MHRKQITDNLIKFVIKKALELFSDISKMTELNIKHVKLQQHDHDISVYEVFYRIKGINQLMRVYVTFKDEEYKKYLRCKKLKELCLSQEIK